MEIRKDRIGQDAVDAAIPTLTEKTDEAAVVRWIMQFIQNRE